VPIPDDDRDDEPTATTVDEKVARRRYSSIDLEPGARVGRYEIVSLLGAGGMGVVYRARDAELGRDVALKLVTAGIGESDSQGPTRLQREAQALAQLGHPNVIAIYDVGRHEDGVFLAMELVEGARLDEWMRKSHPWREVLRIFRDAGRGLQHEKKKD
jgi:serine/threonine protein kinase